MQHEFTPIATDIPGAEGPCFDCLGRFFMVAPNRGQVLQVGEEGAQREHAVTGGIPAGLQCDRENHLWVADMKLGILRVSPDGAVTPVVTEYAGAPIRGCNDCAFDSTGNLYFTAPAGSGEGRPEGELFCRTVDGQVHRLDGGYQFCNGLAVTADDRTLIVAETMTKSLWAYDIQAPARVGTRRLWAVLPGDHRGGPDGMDFDAAGFLLATNWGGGHIEVFAPDGSLSERIALPFAKPSNVHFGGDGGRWVYVTEHDRNGLWKFRWHRPGQRQFCDVRSEK